jgi:hypothetical protein
LKSVRSFNESPYIRAAGGFLGNLDEHNFGRLFVAWMTAGQDQKPRIRFASSGDGARSFANAVDISWSNPRRQSSRSVQKLDLIETLG